LPFHPLRGGPTPRLRHLPAVGPGRRNQHKLLRLPVRRGCREDASYQTKNRRRRADAQRQREHGNHGEAGLLKQHSHAKAQILKHLVVLRYFPFDATNPRGVSRLYPGIQISP
jgi:hypothetical protein